MGGESRDGYRWVVLATSVATQGVTNCYLLGLAAVAPEVQAALQLTLPQVGVVLAAPVVGLTLTTLVWGMACDRWDESRLLAVGLLGASGALFFAASRLSFNSLLVCLLLAGASGAVANTATSRSVVAWFPTHERGMALGFRHMSAPAGVLAAGLVLPHLATSGLESCLYVLASLTAVAALVAPPMLRWRRLAEPPAVRSNATVLRNPQVWRMSVAASLAMVPQAALLSYMTLFLTSTYSVSLATAGLLLALTHGCAAVGRVTVGWLSDRLRYRVPILRLLALVSGLSTIAVGLALKSSINIVMPILGVATLFSSVPNGLNFAAVAELADADRAGTAIGLINTATTAAGAAASIGFGIVVSWVGWRGGFAVIGLAALAAWRVLGPMAADRRRSLSAGGRDPLGSRP